MITARRVSLKLATRKCSFLNCPRSDADHRGLGGNLDRASMDCEGLPTHSCEQKHVGILGGGFQVFHFLSPFWGSTVPPLE